MLDLADLIEQFPKRSCATLKNSRLKIGQRWPEDEMRENQIYGRPEYISENRV